MNEEEIISAVRKKIQDSEVKVKLDGNNIHLVVVSEIFGTLRPVQKQQKVYAALSSYIASGALHAVTMETLTPSEWDKAKMFR